MVIPENMQMMILATSTAVLFVLVIGLFLYARGISARLKKSVGLINDLYKLTQQQENKLAETDVNLSEASISSQERLFDLESFVQRDVEFQNNTTNMLNQFNSRFENIESQTQQVTDKLSKLTHQTELLVQEDPELKMYHHANEMAALGAGIDDIVETCRLPRAEAEVLIGVHQKRTKAS